VPDGSEGARWRPAAALDYNNGIMSAAPPYRPPASRSAAAATLLLLLALGLLLALAPAGVSVATLQPAELASDPARWQPAIGVAPGWAVAFYLGDSLFALALAWLFVALRRELPPGPLLAIALWAALGKAAADLTENGLLLASALAALQGDWTLPRPGALVALAMAKRGLAAIASIALAAAFPGEDGLARLCRLLLAAMGFAAALGFLVPALQLAHVTLLFGFLAALLWRQRAGHAA